MAVRESMHIAEEESQESFEKFSTEKDGKTQTPFTQLLCEMCWADLLSAKSVLLFINDDN